MRQRAISTVSFGILLLTAGPAWAGAGSLSQLIPTLFGEDGIVQERVDGLACCPGGGHEPHFRVESQGELTTLNNALRGQLANFPVPTPASGFTFRFDPTLGTLTRSTESFGPIYADRAETVGRGKFALGFSYARFTFDQIDGKDLKNGELQLTFLHDATDPRNGRRPPFAFEPDTITAQIFADITADQFIFSGTYGVLDNLDVSVAIPMVRVSMDVRGVATSNNETNTRLPDGTLVHKFADGSTTLTATASDSAFGLGDILLRGKYTFFRRAPAGLATGLELRVPSGDEDELLGLGTVRVRPFFVASTKLLGVAPHVNVGLDLGDTSELDNELFYRVGFDWSALPQVTFAFDLLGRYVIDNQRPKAGRAPGSGEISDDNILDAALGLKINPWRNVLLLFNVLLSLNDTGLRDSITPLLGLEVSF
jgi:Putative MetA-pathway of phenol degradation